jgi:deoxycytidylate deaminase
MFPECYGQHKLGYHFAFIYRRTKLISFGINNPCELCPKTLYFAKRFNIEKYKKFNYRHAEIDAIRKCWGKIFLDSNYQMVVLRLNKNRELLESRPCENCQAVLDEIGIRKVWYSTKKGFETYIS